MSEIITIPHAILKNGLNHIPPPSPTTFTDIFKPTVTGQSLPSSWGTTHYYSLPPPSPNSSTPILLVHGVGVPALGMLTLAQSLNTTLNTRVIIYDLWGHGLSSSPLIAHTPSLMHAQILELLLHLNIPKVRLLGFSLGGAISITFANTHASLVESLVLAAPAGLWHRSGFWEWVYMGGFGREAYATRTIIDLLEGVPELGWKERARGGIVEPAALEQWERDEHRGHAASVVSTYRYAGVFDSHEVYREVATKGDMKTLVLLGSEDTVFREETWKSELKTVGWKGDIKVVQGGEHGFVRSHVKEVTAILETFWAAK